jgi:hypothetical protein
MTRVTKGGRPIQIHFSTSRILIGERIHGAPLAASTPFVRERAMDVHMKN